MTTIAQPTPQSSAAIRWHRQVFTVATRPTLERGFLYTFTRDVPMPPLAVTCADRPDTPYLILLAADEEVTPLSAYRQLHSSTTFDLAVEWILGYLAGLEQP